jgi:hypothetical protein
VSLRSFPHPTGTYHTLNAYREFHSARKTGRKTGTGRCEKIDLETWSNFGLKKNAPGSVISDRWDFGIHFGSHEISAKSIFSHLPDEVTP